MSKNEHIAMYLVAMFIAAFISMMATSYAFKHHFYFWEEQETTQILQDYQCKLVHK